MTSRFSASRLALRNRRPAVGGGVRSSINLPGSSRHLDRESAPEDQSALSAVASPTRLVKEAASGASADAPEGGTDASSARLSPPTSPSLPAQKEWIRQGPQFPVVEPSHSALNVPAGAQVIGAEAVLPAADADGGPQPAGARVNQPIALMATMESRMRHAAHHRTAVTMNPTLAVEATPHGEVAPAMSPSDQRTARGWPPLDAGNTGLRPDPEPVRPVVIGTIEVINPPPAREQPDSLAELEDRRSGQRRRSLTRWS
jgi:hypothetical protein